MRVLLIEDDRMIGTAMQQALKDAAYAVDWVTDGETAIHAAESESYELALLDLGLPKADGREVLRRLRTLGRGLPVIIVTARDGVDDRIDGLDLGADDYLVKPFALGELLARVRALLRRTRPAGEDAPLWFAGLSLDRQTREASRGGRAIELTRTEYALLELFMRNARQVLTRPLIMERVWNYDFGPTSNPLEVYISYLRRKTEAGGEPRLIHTVRGVGYTLREP
jgi:DNA-binding response OmpR family regulator